MKTIIITDDISLDLNVFLFSYLASNVAFS